MLYKSGFRDCFLCEDRASYIYIICSREYGIFLFIVIQTT